MGERRTAANAFLVPRKLIWEMGGVAVAISLLFACVASSYWAEPAVFASQANSAERSESPANAESAFGLGWAESDDLRRILEKGQSLERQSRWGEALSIYEDALRHYPDDKALQDRFHIARMHYDLLRRYGDRTFLDSVRNLNTTQAVQVFDEVLLKIQAHYVESPGWRELFEQGVRALAIAVGEPKFLAAHEVHLSAEAVASTARDLPLVARSETVTSRSAALAAATRLTQWLQERIGLAPKFAIMELVCGTVNALDPYSAYLTPAQLAELYSQIEGNFVGLGIELRPQDDALIVLRVIPGSPAEKAGIRPGFRIVVVEGKSVKELSPDRAADMLKGPEGTEAALTIVDASGQPREIKVRRTRVEVPSVTDLRLVDAESGVGYFRLLSFQRTTAQDVQYALEELSRQGLQSLIIDLRGNPGGLLGAAVETADLFLNQGVVVSTRGRNPQENLVYSAHGDETWRIPLVVLVDKESASAAEIFAGAVQDLRRGTLVGTPSYGKGSIQGIFPLSGVDAGLRLTTARFFSPSGRPYAGRGVIPDIRVQEAARPTLAFSSAGQTSGEQRGGQLSLANPQAGVADGGTSESAPSGSDPILEAGIRAARQLVAQRSTAAR